MHFKLFEWTTSTSDRMLNILSARLSISNVWHSDVFDPGGYATSDSYRRSSYKIVSLKLVGAHNRSGIQYRRSIFI